MKQDLRIEIHALSVQRLTSCVIPLTVGVPHQLLVYQPNSYDVACAQFGKLHGCAYSQLIASISYAVAQPRSEENLLYRLYTGT